MMKKSHVLAAVLALSGCIIALQAAETGPAAQNAPDPAVPVQPRRAGQPEKPRMRRELASAIWRAFASLPEKERAELLKLQREDWNAYHQKILALGEKLLAEEKARRAALEESVRRYRDPKTSAQEKAKLKVRIQEALRADYGERLRENRRRINEMKRRTAKMEKELDRRSAEMDKAVAARLNYVLKTGNLDLPPPPRPLHRGPGRGLPPPPPPPPPPPQQK